MDFNLNHPLAQIGNDLADSLNMLYPIFINRNSKVELPNDPHWGLMLNARSPHDWTTPYEEYFLKVEDLINSIERKSEHKELYSELETNVHYKNVKNYLNNIHEAKAHIYPQKMLACEIYWLTTNLEFSHYGLQDETDKYVKNIYTQTNFEINNLENLLKVVNLYLEANKTVANGIFAEEVDNFNSLKEFTFELEAYLMLSESYSGLE